ncbi:hypothetical protein TNCV_2629251 [Trichonephila clavipes]|uniref:Uncharacterized protein n=1 Tax=Trichonephila clavipes TaxID=2585209 RepID=A0A8X6SDJ1_TRICX|nr:hypothetical protein TNCV_2629251 [Trichonephila clavipes]
MGTILSLIGRFPCSPASLNPSYLDSSCAGAATETLIWFRPICIRMSGGQQRMATDVPEQKSFINLNYQVLFLEALLQQGQTVSIKGL